jgi:L-alanine-DL-glutamate epimerase-like enolase superfamily enzyme
MATVLRKMEISQEHLLFTEPFHLFGHIFTFADVLVVSIQQDGVTGRGEASGVYYLNDDLKTMIRQVELARRAVEQGVSRQNLLSILPPGGARNAIDCALWELEARLACQPVWQLAGLPRPRPMVTSFTLGAEHPRKVRDNAVNRKQAKALRLKLSGDLKEDAERVALVREARPDCWIGVDADQAYALRDFERLLPHLAAAKIQSIEQPVPRGREAELKGLVCSIPIAADESVQSHADLVEAVDYFSAVNIQLDKCGGLTAALHLARRATALGFDLMVSTMPGSSLATAPSFLLGQLCSIVDLDWPTFLAKDRERHVVYEQGRVWCPQSVWGYDGSGTTAATP